MGQRNRRRIETNRAVLVVDPTAIAKAGVGNIVLTGGSSGTVNGITVDGVQIMSGAVTYDTSLANTAQLVADNINAYTSSPNYFAHAVGTTVKIFQETIVAGTLATVVSTTTLTATDEDVTGGTVGAGGDILGFTVNGVEIEFQDQYVEDAGEEDGATITKIFYNGGSPILRVALKQFDPEVLAARFPGRFDSANQLIQIPGTLNPGDSMVSQAVTLELRPDSTASSTVLAFLAVLIGRGDEPVRFRTTEPKMVSLEFRLLEDTSITSGPRVPYRTVGVAPGYALSLT